MAIDEAIARERELAERNLILLDSDELVQKSYDTYLRAEYHEQIVMWLEELKVLKENSISKEAFEKMKSKAYKKGHRQGYNKAINDFADKIISLCDDGEFMNRFNEFPATTILEIAEQLREGVEDGNNE